MTFTAVGLKPTATHASTLNGIVEKDKKEIDFILIAYALDDNEKAVYILKAVGNKVLKDKIARMCQLPAVGPDGKKV